MLPDSVRPSKFEEIIVEDSDSFCLAVRKTFIQLPILLYRLTKWMFLEVDPETEEDIALSAEFGADVCNYIATCPPEDTTTTT